MNRRAFLTVAATAGSGVLAGCLDGLGSEESVPEPLSLAGGKFDDDHGMEIGPHGGANAQLFYQEETPSDREAEAFWFHTLAFSGFPFYFDRRDRGWETEVFYVTDFSAVDWTVQEREAGPTMPSPTAPETFGDATEMTYVAGSDVRGGMGPDLHPFSAESDADAFVADHGGETLAFDDITRTLVEGLREEG
jgi:copper chaperone NosL